MAPSRRGQSGAASVEAAITIGAFVFAFAGLMEVVGATYENDAMERAAQAAARAVALSPFSPNPKNVACAAIRRELQYDDAFICTTKWPKFTVDKDVKPDELPDRLLELNGTVKAVAGNTGDMVLVRIPWSRNLFSFEDGYDPDNPATVTKVAMGLARAEP